MKKMGIDEQMRLGQAVELFPSIFPLIKQLGVCCINEDNENLSVGELCAGLGIDAASFVDAANSLL